MIEPTSYEHSEYPSVLVGSRRLSKLNYTPEGDEPIKTDWANGSTQKKKGGFSPIIDYVITFKPVTWARCLQFEPKNTISEDYQFVIEKHISNLYNIENSLRQSSTIQVLETLKVINSSDQLSSRYIAIKWIDIVTLNVTGIVTYLVSEHQRKAYMLLTLIF